HPQPEVVDEPAEPQQGSLADGAQHVAWSVAGQQLEATGLPASVVVIAVSS
ncbi:MAG: hypothetical protein QOD72_1152, partial [Acidimicrobiaceae bacterium]|nr:hypothetical protein [Acidimicrobiaceae bacterium]